MKTVVELGLSVFLPKTLSADTNKHFAYTYPEKGSELAWERGLSVFQLIPKNIIIIYLTLFLKQCEKRMDISFWSQN